jgi:signal transduction histidine kinase/HAMP domain-containing protein
VSKKRGLRQEIQITTTSFVVLLAFILMLLMAYFIGSVTDSMLLKTLPALAKTAAGSLESRFPEPAMGDTEHGREAPELIMGYRYDVLSEVLENINISPHGDAFIINAEGELQVHREISRVRDGQTIYDIYGRDPKLTEIVSRAFQGNSGAAIMKKFQITGFLVSLFSTANSHFFGYAPIRGTPWVLIIETPQSDFMIAPRKALIVSTSVTLIFLVVFSLLFGFLIKKVLIEPLKVLTASAHRLALGQFSRSLPESMADRSDEIGFLGEAYTTMAESINDVIVDIDHITWSARTGNLDKRSPLSYHQGDYYRIIAGVNTTLDVITAQLDSIPDALALVGENREFRYHNKAMAEFFKRNSLDPEDPSTLAYIVSSGASRELVPEADAVFQVTEGGEGALGAYTAEVAISGEKEEASNYVLALRRTGTVPAGAEDTPGSSGSSRLADQIAALMGVRGTFAAAAEGGERAPVCVMLIMSDVTQLTRARIGAEMASRAKSDFLSRMSHEMRTPMNAIIGMTHIAKSSLDPNRKDYCLDKIDEASTHLLGVINDILDMSKIEANKLELAFEEFNFEKMIMKVTNVSTFKIVEKNQNFIVHLDPKIPSTLVGDDQRLSQVIANLLSNSVKFTPREGTIRLDAELLDMSFLPDLPSNKNETLPGSGIPVCTIKISVSDTGIGITEEQKGRLFSSFEQADGGISRKFGGTGLGLAISKRLVEMMGGAIWVESKPGEGASFIFTIKARQGSGRQSSVPPAYPEKGENNFENYTIILAEDVEINREIVLTLLEDTNLGIDCAENGKAALKLFSENPGRYDLIFMDVHMPEMDGFEATRRIRALDLPKAKTIPIVAMTANVFKEDIEKCLNAGMNDHVGKPLDIMLVLEKLRAYLPVRQSSVPVDT